MDKRKPVPPCPECGEHFENVFEATDHLLEDDEEFDPALILPNGYRLMIGSLLRCIYKYSDKPEHIKGIAESTYMTLFTAETQPNVVAGLIEDMIVDTQMIDLDNELKQLLEKGE
jgi:hypothetical protein